MNRIDVFKYGRFPLSAETLDFLQQMAVLMAKTAGIGGDNFILSGCAEVGTTVQSGIVVVAGEVMPFEGGTKETYIIVEETKRSVTAEGTVYNDIYIERKARFGTGPGQLEWGLFTPALPVTELARRIDNVIPRGLISMWSGAVNAIPDGWTLCDGNNGAPDLRGRFVVGHSEIESEFETIGKIGGEKMVALTIEQLPAHAHGYQAPLLVGDHPGGDSGYDRPNSLNSAVTSSVGNGDSHNNLPPYYALAFIMKT